MRSPLCCLTLLVILVQHTVARSEESVPHILFLTQSKGFVHDPVKRGSVERGSENSP